MSVKLTDTQRVMLGAAAQREDLRLTAPDKLKGAILTKVSERLVKLGLVREVRAKAGMPVWRRDDAAQGYALKLTAAGLKAIAVDVSRMKLAICDQSGSAGAKLHLCLFRQLQGVLHLDAKISDGALELGVAQ
jgi:hypothetical protein